MSELWPQAGFRTQYGPTPSMVYPDVEAVVTLAHERHHWCRPEQGMVVRIIMGVGSGLYVGYNVAPDGTHTFHEANGCGMVWARNELKHFLDFLRSQRVGTTRLDQQPGYKAPGSEPKPIPLPATSP